MYAEQHHCLFVEYPGFNSAEGGIYSEREFLDTAETAYDMAVTYFPNVPISLFGQSIGTGAAAYLAGQHPSEIERVVLHAPYTSLTDLIGYHVNPCLAAIFSYYRVNTQDYLVDYVSQNLTAEVVLIHADEENADRTVIPQAHSVAINTACQRAREMSQGQQNIILFKLHRDYGHDGLPDEIAEKLFCNELSTLDPAPFRQPPSE
ncbi:hydrolase, partial [Elysia marginata]